MSIKRKAAGKIVEKGLMAVNDVAEDLLNKAKSKLQKMVNEEPKPKPKLGGAGGRKFKDRVKKKPGSGKSLDDLMKKPSFQKALKSGELTLGEIKTGATRVKPTVAERRNAAAKEMFDKANRKPKKKSQKDKLEDAVIVGGGIGTAAVLGKKAEENKSKKPVKKAKGGMMKSKGSAKGGKMGGKMMPGYKKGGAVKKVSKGSSRGGKRRGVGAAKRGFGKALR